MPATLLDHQNLSHCLDLGAISPLGLKSSINYIMAS